MSKVVRITVPIEEQHLEVYKAMAKLGGLSTGRCIGEWLGDTLDSALFVSNQMQQAKTAPQRVLNEMLALQNGLKNDILETKQYLRSKSAGADVPQGTGSAARYPPSSNTGVNPNRKGGKNG
jgi:hypothetical protein